MQFEAANRYTLFTRAVCPLCDEAAELVEAVGLHWTDREIDGQVDLLVRYRQAIPVLRDERSGRELPWPFTLASLQEFIADA